MAVLTNPQKNSAHWYTRDGKPRHTMPRANDEGDRPTTLRDARTQALLPSVTGILSVIDKPQLERWKLRRVALAAPGVNRGVGEPDDGWADRVIEAAMAPVGEAASLGSSIHKALDNALAGSAHDPALSVYVKPVIEWVASVAIVVVETEAVLTNVTDGYAGSTDLLFRWGRNADRVGALDYKTRKTVPDKPVEAYDTEAMQLVAYCRAKWPNVSPADMLVANVIISTTEPGRVEVVKHDPAKLTSAWNAFLGACALWRYLKGYDPRTASHEAKHA